jgi:hypothetical protein
MPILGIMSSSRRNAVTPNVEYLVVAGAGGGGAAANGSIGVVAVRVVLEQQQVLP